MSETATWITRARAAETLRADRLFDDGFAVNRVIEADGDGLAGLRATPAARFDVLAVRTRFFDDHLMRVVPPGGQVVLLGAGWDSRAFRLPWAAGVRLFEVDLPELVALKAEAVRRDGAHSRCTRRAVGSDLTGEWPAALLDAGFTPRTPTAWVAEGLLYYLTDDDALRLLAQVGALSLAGSTLALEHVSTDLYRSPWAHDWLAKMARQGRPWRSGVDDPVGLLADLGWSAVTCCEPADLPYARHRVIPRTPPPPARGAARTWLVTATRPIGATGNGGTDEAAGD